MDCSAYTTCFLNLTSVTNARRLVNIVSKIRSKGEQQRPDNEGGFDHFLFS
jgi:hypothetical protein